MPGSREALLRCFGNERQRARPVNGIGIDLDFSAAAVAFGPPPFAFFLLRLSSIRLSAAAYVSAYPWFSDR